MEKIIGWAFFLVLNLCFAVTLVYLIETHEDVVWSVYWSVLALFCCYAIFLAGWLIIKTCRLKLQLPKALRSNKL